MLDLCRYIGDINSSTVTRRMTACLMAGMFILTGGIKRIWCGLAGEWPMKKPRFILTSL
jgi:hypothetical protein